MQFARQLKTYGRKTVRWDGFTNHNWIILGMVGGIGFISLGNSVISILSRFQFGSFWLMTMMTDYRGRYFTRYHATTVYPLVN